MRNIDLYEEKIEKTTATKKINYKGKNKDMPVYRIPINMLYYNDKNDRIATYLSKYKAKKGNFEELSVEQKNEIIEDFIIQSNPAEMKKTKNNIKRFQQRVPGVVLKDGRVIDGNRRFTCLRKLNNETGKSEFAYFDAIILDKVTDKEIKKLELELQHGEDKPVDYNPIEKLVGVYNDIIKGDFTVVEYANSIDKKPKEVQKMVDEAELMIDFLEYIPAPEEFYIAKEMDLDGPFNEILNIKKRLKDDDEKWERARVALFDYILMRPEGDLTRLIRAMGNNIINSDNEEEFFENHVETSEQIGQKIKEQIDKKGEIDLDFIREELRKDEKIVKKLEDNFEEYSDKTKYENARRRPIDQMRDFTGDINEIDTYAVSKLSEEEKNEIKEYIEDIKTKIKDIEEVL